MQASDGALMPQKNGFHHHGLYLKHSPIRPPTG